MDTQINPNIAASAKAIPNDYVNGVFKKISHSAIFSKSFSWSEIIPNSLTWLCRLYISIISYKAFLFIPSPAISIYISTCYLQRWGKIYIKRSVPLL